MGIWILVHFIKRFKREVAAARAGDEKARKEAAELRKFLREQLSDNWALIDLEREHIAAVDEDGLDLGFVRMFQPDVA